MKTPLLLAAMLACLCCFPAHAQKRLNFSLTLSPVYNQSHSKSEIPSGADSTISIRSRSFSTSAGLMINYELSPRLSVSTGLWATRLVSGHTDISFNSDNIQVMTPKTFRVALKAPVLVNYQLPEKRLSPYLSAGAAIDFRSKTLLDVGGNEVAVKVGKPLKINPVIGAGIRYKLNPSASFVLQPMMQFYLQKPLGATSYGAYQFRLQAQFNYTF